MKKRCLLFIAIGLLSVMNISYAALIDTGSGLINDNTLNVTWMKDANLFQTLCDAGDPIATEFVPVDSADAATICKDNGVMSWNDAEAWIARLNAQSYLGYSDWRQPLTTQPDASCEEQDVVDGFSNQGWGYRCQGSELGHLFYRTQKQSNNDKNGAINGNNSATDDAADADCNSNCFANADYFVNVQKFAYWSGSSYAPDPANVWIFGIDNGSQDYDGITKNNDYFHVWPVRSGLSMVAIDATQDVSTLLIWGLGFMVMLSGFIVRRLIRLLF